MDTVNFNILVSLLVGVYLLYRYLTKNFDHWDKRNVKGPKPKLFYGTSKDFILKSFYGGDEHKEIYNSYPDEPAVGLFARSKPVLMVKGVDMIKEVLVKSFSSFPNRGFHISVDIEPLAENLFFVEYQQWKPLRKKLAPVFTSGKLKDMFHLIVECAEKFVELLNGVAEKNEPVECRDLAAKFTIDVIGVCAFGLDIDIISNEHSDFRECGRSIMADTWSNRLVFIARMMPYWASKILTPLVQNEKANNYFINSIRSTMEYRKKNNVRRNDFVDLLVDMKENPEQMGEKEITDIFITAQAFIFFVAAFETSSTTISHTLYELSLNPDIQDKVRAEVIEVCDKNGGQLTYDSVKNMKYLDKVLKETLRKYPPFLFLNREAATDYKFEGSNISVSKGTSILIPVYAIHHDPRIYPDPEKYDPERFDEKVASSRPHMSYLPFGDGPRICIGNRFADNQSKLGLATAIKNFKFETCEKTPMVYKKRLTGLTIASENGLYLKIKKLVE